MLNLRVLLPVLVNPDTRYSLHSLCREYFPEDIQSAKTVAGVFCDVCCQIKVPGRYAGTYSNSKRRGAEKHNGAKNMRRTEVGGTVRKLLHKLQNWLSLFRYYTGYNERCRIKSVDQGTVYYTDIKKGRSFDE
jgi:hypothetical protein